MKLEEKAQVLRKLGLTYSQAKVYIALATVGSSTANNTAKLAQVVRQEIYRILKSLQEIGLIEKVIAKPTIFRAIPIEQGISTLMDRRNKDTVELKKQTRKLILSLAKKAKNNIPHEQKQFILIPKREALITRIRKAIENSQDSVDIIASGTIMPQVLFNLSENFKQAMEKGVKIRYITDKIEDATEQSESLAALKQNPNFQFRSLSNPPDTRVGIYDKREVLIGTHLSRGAFQTNALWSNNPSLVAAITDHFEKNWLIAKKA